MKLKPLVMHPLLALLLMAVFPLSQALAGAQVRLLAFTRVGAAHEVLLAGADGKLLKNEPLELPTNQLSKACDVTSRSLVFLDPSAKTESADAQKMQVAVLGKVDLPEGENEFILVFLPNKQGAEYPYQVQALPMPSNNFPSGAQAFVNYGNADVGFVIDKQRLEVPRNKVGIFRAKTDTKNYIQGYEKGADGKWSEVPFYSSRLIVQNGVRNLIFIVRNPQTGRLDFRGVADFVD